MLLLLRLTIFTRVREADESQQRVVVRQEVVAVRAFYTEPSAVSTCKSRHYDATATETINNTQKQNNVLLHHRHGARKRRPFLKQEIKNTIQQVSCSSYRLYTSLNVAVR